MTFVNTKLYFYKTIIACAEIFTQKNKMKDMKYEILVLCSVLWLRGGKLIMSVSLC